MSIFYPSFVLLPPFKYLVLILERDCEEFMFYMSETDVLICIGKYFVFNLHLLKRLIDYAKLLEKSVLVLCKSEADHSCGHQVILE